MEKNREGLVKKVLDCSKRSLSKFFHLKLSEEDLFYLLNVFGVDYSVFWKLVKTQKFSKESWGRFLKEHGDKSEYENLYWNPRNEGTFDFMMSEFNNSQWYYIKESNSDRTLQSYRVFRGLGALRTNIIFRPFQSLRNQYQVFEVTIDEKVLRGKILYIDSVKNEGFLKILMKEPITNYGKEVKLWRKIEN